MGQDAGTACSTTRKSNPNQGLLFHPGDINPILPRRSWLLNPNPQCLPAEAASHPCGQLSARAIARFHVPPSPRSRWHPNPDSRPPWHRAGTAPPHAGAIPRELPAGAGPPSSVGKASPGAIKRITLTSPELYSVLTLHVGCFSHRTPGPARCVPGMPFYPQFDLRNNLGGAWRWRGALNWPRRSCWPRGKAGKTPPANAW